MPTALAARARRLGILGMALIHMVTGTCWPRPRPAHHGACGPLHPAFALPLRYAAPGAGRTTGAQQACGRARHLEPRGMLRPGRLASALLLRRGQQDRDRAPGVLSPRASTSSGLPPDPNPADDAALKAAMGAAGDAEAARPEDTASAAAADAWDDTQLLTPNGLPENSAFHDAPGGET